MWNRMLRAARLETTLYEEVEADTSATKQAMVVVFLSSLALGIGSIPIWGMPGLLLGTVDGLVGWFIWSLLTYVIGAYILKTPATEATYGQLLRTVGFSSAPGILRVLTIVPPIANLMMLVTSVWMLIAMVIAVRQALDYTSTWRAIAVAVVGFIPYIIAVVIVDNIAAGLLGIQPVG